MPLGTLLAMLAAGAGSGAKGYVEGKLAKEKLEEAKETRAMQKKLLELKIKDQEFQQTMLDSLFPGLGGAPATGEPLGAQAPPAASTPQQFEQSRNLQQLQGRGMDVGIGNIPAPVASPMPSAPVRPRASLVDMLVQNPAMIAALETAGIKGVGEAARLHAQQQEARTIDAGDKFLKIDRQGNVIGDLPKPEEYVQVEETLPDGSVKKSLRPKFGKPELGGQGTVPLGVGAPPTEDFTFEGPDGRKMSVIRNKVTGQYLTTPVPVEGIKPPAGEAGAGRMVMAHQATDFLRQLQTMLFKGGKLNRRLVLEMNAPFGGVGEGRKAIAIFDDAIDARIRASTGAAISKEELPYYRSMYLPSPLDSEATATNKLQRAIDYADSLVATIDPEGKARKRMVQPTPGAGAGKKRFTLIPGGK